MSELILQADEISKVYTLWRKPSDRLLAPALHWSANRLDWLPRASEWASRRALRIAQPFHALQSLTITLRRGESLGIVGRNGSGKSTLLQILAGTLTPTTGEVKRSGTLAALLELGSGFNLDFTGRENVYLQAAIYGVPPQEMGAHIEQVLSFAEIGEFIDQPVKTYSSGMLVRLAFAVQVVLKPDILIVDEALAVGDVFFQAKCAEYFRNRLSEGMSLIFVSHDLVSVKALCGQAIVLHKGKVHFNGDSKEAVNIYHELHALEARREHVPSTSLHASTLATRNWQSQDEIGDRDAEFIACEVMDENEVRRRNFSEGETIRLRLHVRARNRVPVLHGAFQLVDRHNRALYGLSTAHLEIPSLDLDAGGEAVFEFSLGGNLGPGDYLIDVALGWGDRGDGAFVHQCHRVGGIASVSVGRLTPKPRFLGPVNLGAQISWRRAM